MMMMIIFDRTYFSSTLTLPLLFFSLIYIEVVWTYVQLIYLAQIVSTCILSPHTQSLAIPSEKIRLIFSYLCCTYYFVSLQRWLLRI